jgi:hypothetical protein
MLKRMIATLAALGFARIRETRSCGSAGFPASAGSPHDDHRAARAVAGHTERERPVAAVQGVMVSAHLPGTVDRIAFESGIGALEPRAGGLIRAEPRVARQRVTADSTVLTRAGDAYLVGLPDLQRVEAWRTVWSGEHSRYYEILDGTVPPYEYHHLRHDRPRSDPVTRVACQPSGSKRIAGEPRSPRQYTASCSTQHSTPATRQDAAGSPASEPPR